MLVVLLDCFHAQWTGGRARIQFNITKRKFATWLS